MVDDEISYENLVIVETDCNLCFGLLASVKSPENKQSIEYQSGVFRLLLTF